MDVFESWFSFTKRCGMKIPFSSRFHHSYVPLPAGVLHLSQYRRFIGPSSKTAILYCMGSSLSITNSWFVCADFFWMSRTYSVACAGVFLLLEWAWSSVLSVSVSSCFLLGTFLAGGGGGGNWDCPLFDFERVFPEMSFAGTGVGASLLDPGR